VDAGVGTKVISNKNICRFFVAPARAEEEEEE
jgi:hypothetical protein